MLLHFCATHRPLRNRYAGVMRERCRFWLASTIAKRITMPMVPAARLELARLAAADFESVRGTASILAHRPIAPASELRKRGLVCLYAAVFAEVVSAHRPQLFAWPIVPLCGRGGTVLQQLLRFL
jgi:hypothetical protein